MKNVKRTLVALTLTLSVALTGCGVVRLNEEKDRKQVVAKVNDAAITKGEVLDIYNSQKAYYQITEEMEKDPAQKENIKKFKESILDSLVQQKVIDQKAKEQKIALSAEERKKVEDDTKAMLDSYRKSFEEQYQKEKEKDPSIDPAKKADEELKALLNEQGLTEKSIIDESIAAEINRKLQDSIIKDIKASEQDVKNFYDENLKTQKETYTKTPAQFDSDEASGEIVLYQPSGYIRVKHILISIPEETQSKIQTLHSEDKTEEAKVERDKALVTIKPKAEEVLTKVQANEDFDKLMETYGEDPGMKTSPYKEKGYLLGKDSSFIEEFKEAALKLSNVGGFTGLVATDFGYHIIKLVEKVPEGAIPFDDVKAAIESNVTREKKAQAWEDAVKSWEKAAKIEKHVNKL